MGHSAEYVVQHYQGKPGYELIVSRAEAIVTERTAAESAWAANTNKSRSQASPSWVRLQKARNARVNLRGFTTAKRQSEGLIQSNKTEAAYKAQKAQARQKARQEGSGLIVKSGQSQSRVPGQVGSQEHLRRQQVGTIRGRDLQITTVVQPGFGKPMLSVSGESETRRITSSRTNLGTGKTEVLGGTLITPSEWVERKAKGKSAEFYLRKSRSDNLNRAATRNIILLDEETQEKQATRDYLNQPPIETKELSTSAKIKAGLTSIGQKIVEPYKAGTLKFGMEAATFAVTKKVPSKGFSFPKENAPIDIALKQGNILATRKMGKLNVRASKYTTKILTPSKIELMSTGKRSSYVSRGKKITPIKTRGIKAFESVAVKPRDPEFISATKQSLERMAYKPVSTLAYTGAALTLGAGFGYGVTALSSVGVAAATSVRAGTIALGGYWAYSTGKKLKTASKGKPGSVGRVFEQELFKAAPFIAGAGVGAVSAVRSGYLPQPSALPKLKITSTKGTYWLTGKSKQVYTGLEYGYGRPTKLPTGSWATKWGGRYVMGYGQGKIRFGTPKLSAGKLPQYASIPEPATTAQGRMMDYLYKTGGGSKASLKSAVIPKKVLRTPEYKGIKQIVGNEKVKFKLIKEVSNVKMYGSRIKTKASDYTLDIAHFRSKAGVKESLKYWGGQKTWVGKPATVSYGTGSDVLYLSPKRAKLVTPKDLDKMLSFSYGKSVKKVAAHLPGLRSKGEKPFVTKDQPLLVQQRIKGMPVHLEDVHSMFGVSQEPMPPPESFRGIPFTQKTVGFTGKSGYTGKQPIMSFGESYLRRMSSISGTYTADGKVYTSPAHYRHKDITRGVLFGEEIAETTSQSKMMKKLGELKVQYPKSVGVAQGEPVSLPPSISKTLPIIGGLILSKPFSMESVGVPELAVSHYLLPRLRSSRSITSKSSKGYSPSVSKPSKYSPPSISPSVSKPSKYSPPSISPSVSKPSKYSPPSISPSKYSPPSITPSVSKIIIPRMLPGGGGGYAGWSWKKKSKRRTKYQPSLVAVGQKIKGKKPKRLTGLEIRPMRIK